MVKTETTEKTKPKGLEKKLVSRGPVKPVLGRAQVVKKMLTRIEAKMGTDAMKATMGDYIRLVQLHKELDEDSPKEIKVTWVEPKSGSGE